MCSTAAMPTGTSRTAYSGYPRALSSPSHGQNRLGLRAAGHAPALRDDDILRSPCAVVAASWFPRQTRGRHVATAREFVAACAAAALHWLRTGKSGSANGGDWGRETLPRA